MKTLAVFWSSGRSRYRSGMAAGLLLMVVTATIFATRPAAPRVTAQVEPMDVAVRALGIARLYAAEIGLRFDPEQVSPVDAMPSIPGLQLRAGRGWGGGPFVLVNEVDAEAGTARFSATLLSPAEPLAGDLELLVLPLRLRRLEPEDAWGLTDVLLLDRRGEEIEASWEGTDIRPRFDWPAIQPRSLLPWTGR